MNRKQIHCSVCETIDVVIVWINTLCRYLFLNCKFNDTVYKYRYNKANETQRRKENESKRGVPFSEQAPVAD